MTKTAIRLVQRRLAELGHYEGAIDGRRGPLTHAAARAALADRAPDLPDGWQGWSDRRRVTGVLQLWCRDLGIDAGPVDGWWGPQTEYGVDTLGETLDPGRDPVPWRDVGTPAGNPNGWPPQSPEAALAEIYGPHGLPGGRTPPLVRVACPWRLRIAWNRNRTTREIAIHERCAESLARVLARVWDEHGQAEITRLGLDLFGGSYNPRRMRGGSRWSMHAWGVAIDWDPAHNRYRWGRDRARMAHPDYDAWWRAWEEEGWVALGRARNYDWMHVQAARL